MVRQPLHKFFNVNHVLIAKFQSHDREKGFTGLHHPAVFASVGRKAVPSPTPASAGGAAASTATGAGPGEPAAGGVDKKQLFGIIKPGEGRERQVPWKHMRAALGVVRRLLFAGFGLRGNATNFSGRSNR